MSFWMPGCLRPPSPNRWRSGGSNSQQTNRFKPIMQSSVRGGTRQTISFIHFSNSQHWVDPSIHATSTFEARISNNESPFSVVRSSTSRTHTEIKRRRIPKHYNLSLVADNVVRDESAHEEHVADDAGKWWCLRIPVTDHIFHRPKCGTPGAVVCRQSPDAYIEWRAKGSVLHMFSLWLVFGPGRRLGKEGGCVCMCVFMAGKRANV